MMDEINAAIQQGQSLLEEGSEQQAIDYFRALAQQYPNHALVEFELGGAYDFAGFEADAIPHYRRALELGLPDEVLVRLYVQMGSSLRNVNAHAEAVTLLREAHERFPQHRALRAFYALALHSAGQQGKALAQMLHLTLDAPDFYEAYNRSLRYYAEALTADTGQEAL